MRDARLDHKPDIEQLSKDDRISKMRGMKHIWAAGTANQSLIRAVEVGDKNLSRRTAPAWTVPRG